MSLQRVKTWKRNGRGRGMREILFREIRVTLERICNDGRKPCIFPITIRLYLEHWVARYRRRLYSTLPKEQGLYNLDTFGYPRGGFLIIAKHATMPRIGQTWCNRNFSSLLSFFFFSLSFCFNDSGTLHQVHW